MNKLDALYNYIKNKERVTCKEIQDLGYARIYLTNLLKENKIYKIGRGVYSINENTKIDPLYEFQRNNSKIIYSGFTALDLMGIYKSNIKEISVPQGYNATRYNDYEIFYINNDIYDKGITLYNINGYDIKIYDIERSVAHIIKNENRYDKSLYNKFIYHYFNNSKINYTKLLEYSTLLKINKKVSGYLALFKA